MSRTFNHKRNHSGKIGVEPYRTAKLWRTSYNRAVRHLNRVRVNCVAPIYDDVIFVVPHEITAKTIFNRPWN